MTNAIIPRRPPRLLRVCAIEGCNTITAGRRCDDHQRQLERNLATLAGGSHE